MPSSYFERLVKSGEALKVLNSLLKAIPGYKVYNPVDRNTCADFINKYPTEKKQIGIWNAAVSQKYDRIWDSHFNTNGI